MKEGVVFFKSANGVILSEGIDGKISTTFLERVENTNGEVLEI